MTITEFAPAKINLTLHVTGQRADGYHLLDSLVVFATVGDHLALRPGPLSLRIDGPNAGAPGLGGDDDLCLRAARLAGGQAEITLTKRLPVASGIGGGSADAAAVLRALARMGHALPAQPEQLGADVPACLISRPLRMQGIGEDLSPLHGLPDLHLLLVNPGIAVPTPAVFAGLNRRDNAPMPALPEGADLAGWISWLGACRNDLEAPARALAPEIGESLAMLRDEGALLARMSGSGATCFGIFADKAAAHLAAYRIGAARAEWWVAPAGLAPAPASV